ncbi:hypothetical protein H5410_060896 [Solanum commersonii]|uniref:Uncharacterized protein n=1 Tax=Solanum commersonii TaxID=4109 RepID=A0A9J5W6H2_SOLCO|nr:hypothetical protein H5410_060896 [Solanum commersonii]
MIKHKAKMIDLQPGPHHLAYGNMLIKVFQAFDVPLGEAPPLNKKDMITTETLAECLSLPLDNPAPEVAPRVTHHFSQLLVDLHVARDQNGVL